MGKKTAKIATKKQVEAVMEAAKDNTGTGESMDLNPYERLRASGMSVTAYRRPEISVRAKVKDRFGRDRVGGRKMRVAVIDGEVMISGTYGDDNFFGKHDTPRPKGSRFYGLPKALIDKLTELAKELQDVLEQEGLDAPPSSTETYIKKADMTIDKLVDLERVLSRTQRIFNQANLPGEMVNGVSIESWKRALSGISEGIEKEIRKIENYREAVEESIKHDERTGEGE